ncbi:MAG: hypothetical protein EON56_06250 [Alphaproteobacteria bacterium]|nr:MAG: hypothetical protein EON56_06250 [Alphaproteobacteria bacterium]
MLNKKLGPAYRSMMTAANDQYHAVASINTHGEIRHAHAVAQVLLEQGYAKNQAQAVQLAADEVARTGRLARGEQVNRKAHIVLKAETQERQARVTAPAAGNGFDLVV